MNSVSFALGAAQSLMLPVSLLEALSFRRGGTKPTLVSVHSGFNILEATPLRGSVHGIIINFCVAKREGEVSLTLF